VAAGVYLVEHAGFGEAQRSFGEVLVEEADLGGVKAVEGADIGNDAVCHDEDSDNEIVDLVNYLASRRDRF
jgi:hypothetical protein